MKRDLLSVILFLILYLFLNILIITVFTFFPGIIENFWNYFENISFIIVFSLLFILQQIIVLFLLFLSFKYWKKLKTKELKNFIKDYYKEQIKWYWFWNFLFYTFWMYIIYIIISWTLLLIINYLNVEIPWLFWEQDVAQVIWQVPTHFWYEYLIIFIMVAIIAPLVEEIIYRWFITKILLDNYRPIIWIFISAVIFATIHFEWAVILNLLILALILWYIYYKTKSLIQVFGFHALVNWLAVFALFYAEELEELENLHWIIFF